MPNAHTRITFRTETESYVLLSSHCWRLQIHSFYLLMYHICIFRLYFGISATILWPHHWWALRFALKIGFFDSVHITLYIWLSFIYYYVSRYQNQNVSQTSIQNYFDRLGYWIIHMQREAKKLDQQESQQSIQFITTYKTYKIINIKISLVAHFLQISSSCFAVVFLLAVNIFGFPSKWVLFVSSFIFFWGFSILVLFVIQTNLHK